MDRRAMVQWLVATGTLVVGRQLSAQNLVRLGEDAHVRLRNGEAQPVLLTPNELRTVAAAAECIIPRTETPGATDAKVADFISVMMSEWYPPSDIERFRDGLASLETTSTARFGRTFADATPAQQVELVAALDRDVIQLRQTDPKSANAIWFAVLKYLTVWGYCTSEVAMRNVFKSYPRAMRYDGAAPLG